VVIVTASASSPPVRRRGTFNDVVCAVDYSPSSMAALRAAVRFVRGRHGRLTLVHAVDEVSDRMIFSGGEAVRVLREYEARLARERRRPLRLEPLRSLDPWQVKVVVASGPPSRVVLAAAADVKADLMALGTAGLGVLGALLGGSTSRAVLRRAGCPVLLTGKGAVRSGLVRGDQVSLPRGRAA
jgi:nucleotide-binding universal stress UspA family protein